MSGPATPQIDIGLMWRPLNRSDIPAWHELIRAIDEVDRPAEHYTHEDLEDELYDGSWKDPANDSIAGFAHNGSVQAFAHVTVFPGMFVECVRSAGAASIPRRVVAV